MSYQVLARKWRPRTFAELVGQEHVVRPLVHALEHGRVHHAFLFTGTRGVGKTTIARILAKSLNCERGVTATPCGECTSCREVDEGRFVDLIEVDAASRTKVDDTRELLDNVQYAPTRGRYKVYLIDEVHMLSGHSFNALLKTLEEPPPHVKFLLATTDPQKLPVTVLSRCLQFSLKRLSPDQIGAQLRKILEAEKLEFEAPSLALLAQAADGSMRDGLSLLDQAIAYGGGSLREADVRAMLGTIDQDCTERLITALASGDAAATLAVVGEVAEHQSDYGAVLDELMRGLHRIALAQTDPALAQEPERERVLAHAQHLAPEDTQLFYQIALMGRRDMYAAPDPRTALEMTLLRMLVFRPAGEEGRRAPASTPPPTSVRRAAAAVTAAPVAKPATAPATARVAPPAAGTLAELNWSATVAQLKLGGLVRELANNSVVEEASSDAVKLVLNAAHASLLNREREGALREALEQHLGRELRIAIRVGDVSSETPAQERRRQQDERQQAAVAAIEQDPNVQTLKQTFGARVNPTSIRPK